MKARKCYVHTAFDFKPNNVVSEDRELCNFHEYNFPVLETASFFAESSFGSFVNYIDSFLFVLYNQSLECTLLFFPPFTRGARLLREIKEE